MQDNTTRKIPLTKGKVAIVDAEDYERINRHKWHAAKRGAVWYAARSTGKRGNKEFMHKVIINASPRQIVDHRDRDGLNNTRSNLRVCTHTENMRNRKGNKNTRTGYKGVSVTRERRFQACLQTKEQRFHLGTFPTAEAAARAYDKKATEIFGAFARPNFQDRA